MTATRVYQGGSPTSEDRKAVISAWLNKHGIDPMTVPEDAPIDVDPIERTITIVRFKAWVFSPDGTPPPPDIDESDTGTWSEEVVVQLEAPALPFPIY